MDWGNCLTSARIWGVTCMTSRQSPSSLRERWISTSNPSRIWLESHRAIQGRNLWWRASQKQQMTKKTTPSLPTDWYKSRSDFQRWANKRVSSITTTNWVKRSCCSYKRLSWSSSGKTWSGRRMKEWPTTTAKTRENLSWKGVRSMTIRNDYAPSLFYNVIC